MCAGREKKKKILQMKNKIVLQTWILTELSLVLWIMINIAQALKSLLRQKHGTLTFFYLLVYNLRGLWIFLSMTSQRVKLVFLPWIGC